MVTVQTSNQSRLATSGIPLWLDFFSVKIKLCLYYLFKNKSRFSEKNWTLNWIDYQFPMQLEIRTILMKHIWNILQPFGFEKSITDWFLETIVNHDLSYYFERVLCLMPYPLCILENDNIFECIPRNTDTYTLSYLLIYGIYFQILLCILSKI